jgi:hypothetical protein
MPCLTAMIGSCPPSWWVLESHSFWMTDGRFTMRHLDRSESRPIMRGIDPSKMSRRNRRNVGVGVCLLAMRRVAQAQARSAILPYLRLPFARIGNCPKSPSPQVRQVC